MKMRAFSRKLSVIAFSGICMLLPGISEAAFNSGSTGADGAFNPASNAELEVPAGGVFNFTTVTIPSGVTVTFKKNANNTPVVILAAGDVTISGTIDVSGANGAAVVPGRGGPGGFNGGIGGTAKYTGRRGQGPGGGSGGAPRTDTTTYGGGGGGGGGFNGNGSNGGTYVSYAPGGPGGSGYGNDRILPLIGGSGGGGGGGTISYSGGGGGGGGGAILIASSGAITVGGNIYAKGGKGADGEYYSYGGGGGGGSGGSIRLIANIISGNGAISAEGGAGGYGGGSWSSLYRGGSGSGGRLRLEASTITRTVGTTPAYAFGYPDAITPANMPALAITSAGGIAAPTVPTGAFGSPDVALPYTFENPLSVVVTGNYIPAGTTVTVKAIPEVGSVATTTGTLSGTQETTTATVSLTISTAYPSILVATVTFDATAFNGGLFYAGGEKVDKIRVATTSGGGSTVIYITESGKEIPAVL